MGRVCETLVQVPPRYPFFILRNLYKRAFQRDVLLTSSALFPSLQFASFVLNIYSMKAGARNLHHHSTAGAGTLEKGNNKTKNSILKIVSTVVKMKRRTWRLLPVLPLPFPATEEGACRCCAGEAKTPFEKDELGTTKRARWLGESGTPALLQTGDTSSSSGFCIAWGWAAPGKQVPPHRRARELEG